MRKKSILSLAKVGLFVLFLAACTLYESGGREAIEKNQGNIVTSGFSLSLNGYYRCERSLVTPDFLKEPLEVLDVSDWIEKKFEKQDVSLLLQTSHTPHWLVVYTQQSLSQEYDSCKIYFLKPIRSSTQISEGAQLAVAQMKKFSALE
jgi:hypothetical protein